MKLILSLLIFSLAFCNSNNQESFKLFSFMPKGYNFTNGQKLFLENHLIGKVYLVEQKDEMLKIQLIISDEILLPNDSKVEYAQNSFGSNFFEIQKGLNKSYFKNNEEIQFHIVKDAIGKKDTLSSKKKL